MKTRNLTPIGEVSRRTGISMDTLRRWGRRGTIHVWRTPAGHRLFDLDEVMARLSVHPDCGASGDDDEGTAENGAAQ